MDGLLAFVCALMIDPPSLRHAEFSSVAVSNGDHAAIIIPLPSLRLGIYLVALMISLLYISRDIKPRPDSFDSQAFHYRFHSPRTRALTVLRSTEYCLATRVEHDLQR